MVLKYGRYSFSKIDTFIQCPYKFFIQYILKPDIIKSQSFHLDKGNLVHGVIEAYLKDELNSYKIPNYETLDKNKKKEIFSKILDFCSHNIFKDIKLKEKKEVETVFYLDEKFKPCEKSSAILKGKIDLLYSYDEQLFIIDWKTGGSTLEKLKLYPKKSDQLEIYVIWALQKYNLKEAIASFAFVDFNYYDNRFFTIEDIQQLKEKWIQKIETIEETEEFPRKKSKLCEYCDFQEFCEINEQLEKSFEYDIIFDEIPH